MRSYLIDELDQAHVTRLTDSLEKKGYRKPIEGVFWLPLPVDLLREEQIHHAGDCGPYFVSLETGDDWVKLELLVRGCGRLRCSCVCYANEEQRSYAMQLLDDFLKNLDIPT